MISQQTLQGNWNEIKGKLRSKWGQLTGDDIERFHGNVDQLIGTIQRKTGAARESIESFLDEVSSEGESMVGRATEAVRDYAQQAAEKVRETSKQATESLREGYAQAEGMVRTRPAESLAVCFGVGLVTGVVLGLLLRSR